jgi:two-component system, LytTR family, sensor kinase
MVYRKRVFEMNRIIPKKFLLRALVVYIIQLIIKGFDLSFGRFFDITWRGFLFTLFFMSFWIAVWYISDYLNKKRSHLPRIFRIIFNLCFGYTAAFIANSLYRYGDTRFFHNSVLWDPINIFNPEFTVSLLLFYMLVWGSGQFHEYDLHLKEHQLQAERLIKENAQAQYMSLKAQIEPHFLFNSLSVLDSLIAINAKLASQFTLKLSKTLRYIIDKNEFTLVTIAEELVFVKNYFFLIKNRFAEGISLKVNLDENYYERYYLPPASIQILIENAIKHNRFSEDSPLIIEISISGEFLAVRNNVNKRNEYIDSTHKGLSNLQKRFSLLTEKKVAIINSDAFFEVKMPLLDTKTYESINHRR